MKIKLKVTEDTYFIKLLLILDNIPPFNKLRPKELEMYANLLMLNHKYRSIPFKERNTLIFSYDNKIQIADLMDIKLSGVYNLLSTLRSVGIIEAESLIPKYVLTKTNELTFIFEEEDAD
jgi:hypothetical protein